MKITNLLLRILVPLGISAAALWLASRNLSWNEIKALIKQADLAYLYLGFCVSLIAFWLRALRWKVMLEPFQDLSAWTLLRWQIGGILVNNLLPMRMGELARTYWAGHKSTIPKTTVLATIVVERILDLATVASITLILLATIKLQGGRPLLRPQILGCSVSAGLALILLGRFLTKRKSADEIVQSLKSRLPAKAAAILEHFVSGLHVLKNKREILKLCLLSPLLWSVDIAVLAITSRSLGLNLSWPEAGLTMGGLILGVMIPAAPGAVGTFEAGGVQALSLLGFNRTLAFSFVALLHVFQMVFIFILGIPALMYEGFNPRKLFKEMEQVSGPGPGPGPDTK